MKDVTGHAGCVEDPSFLTNPIMQGRSRGSNPKSRKALGSRV